MRAILFVTVPSNPLHLIEYGDFSCPRCQELQKLLAATLPLFRGEIGYTFRHFPNPGRPPALLMALAAEAARRQDQYGAMHRALFTHTGPVSPDSLSSLAIGLGLDLDLFLNDIGDETLEQRILADVELGRRDEVVATPTLFLGNRRLHGRLTQARLVPIFHHYVDRSNAQAVGPVNHENELVLRYW